MVNIVGATFSSVQEIHPERAVFRDPMQFKDLFNTMRTLTGRFQKSRNMSGHSTDAAEDDAALNTRYLAVGRHKPKYKSLATFYVWLIWQPYLQQCAYLSRRLLDHVARSSTSPSGFDILSPSLKRQAVALRQVAAAEGMVKSADSLGAAIVQASKTEPHSSEIDRNLSDIQANASVICVNVETTKKIASDIKVNESVIKKTKLDLLMSFLEKVDRFSERLHGGKHCSDQRTSSGVVAVVVSLCKFVNKKHKKFYCIIYSSLSKLCTSLNLQKMFRINCK